MGNCELSRLMKFSAPMPKFNSFSFALPVFLHPSKEVPHAPFLEIKNPFVSRLNERLIDCDGASCFSPERDIKKSRMRFMVYCRQIDEFVARANHENQRTMFQPKTATNFRPTRTRRGSVLVLNVSIFNFTDNWSRIFSKHECAQSHAQRTDAKQQEQTADNRRRRGISRSQGAGR
jgi:hypothetical protein